jgi:protein gp37
VHHVDRLDLDGLDWVRDVRARCDAAGVAFFFKQSATIRPERGSTLDGETVRAYPIPRRCGRARASVCPGGV